MFTIIIAVIIAFLAGMLTGITVAEHLCNKKD